MKEKIESTVKSMIIFCKYCQKEGVISSPETLHFSSKERKCDICGSHGEVKLSCTCPNCKKDMEIILNEW